MNRLYDFLNKINVVGIKIGYLIATCCLIFIEYFLISNAFGNPDKVTKYLFLVFAFFISFALFSCIFRGLGKTDIALIIEGVYKYLFTACFTLVLYCFGIKSLITYGFNIEAIIYFIFGTIPAIVVLFPKRT